MNALNAYKRVPDRDGHLIPITGRWCPSCRYPLHPALADTIHPCCDTRGTR